MIEPHSVHLEIGKAFVKEIGDSYLMLSLSKLKVVGEQEKSLNYEEQPYNPLQ